MRYLGIDFGAKRIGLAISDEAGQYSFPFLVMANRKGVVPEIAKICIENKVESIVVGESRNFSLIENDIMKQIHPFIGELKEITHLPIYTHPEFLTSVEARRIQGENDMNDASAAALILKSYLESRKVSGRGEDV